jgi:8-oxo-dGTP pyrophosphatase MutT (NUDIX family)
MGIVIASGLFIVRNDDKLLVAHPTNHDKDFWSIPKGKVEDEETLLEAALRETYEETNLELKDSFDFNIYPLDRSMYKHKKKVLYSFLFLEKKDSELNWSKLILKCNSNVPKERGGFPEMDGYKWVTLLEAKKLLHDTQVACIDKIIEIINTNN